MKQMTGLRSAAVFALVGGSSSSRVYPREGKMRRFISTFAVATREQRSHQPKQTMSKLTVAALALLLFLGSGPCVAITFDFTGSSALDGPDGNIRMFTSDTGLNVNISAFSRDKSNGAWSAAYLGAYSGGLGVTDSSEGGGSGNMYAVDNIGRDNYVLFEFAGPLVLDQADLGFVVTDSDLTVWIGTKTDPFNNHQTLSDAFLSSLGFTEVNVTNLATARTADLNAGEVMGNVIVIAAVSGDLSPEDQFNIATFRSAGPPGNNVPEGGTIGLLALGLACLSLIARKRQ